MSDHTAREPQHTNRLAGETSPYLLQHAHNPVDWYPWGPEALERARSEDRPILLSVGYSACHWCHVMERESFEDEATAAIMNRHFVNVKVDREERPDIDAIYMQAVQAMTGHGGWPMTVFLTPQGEPFFGGTYFPPEERHGMPSFQRVLRAMADAWQNRRDEVLATGRKLSTHLQEGLDLQPSRSPLQPSLLDQAAQGLVRQFDRRYGGFGGAPKFPQPMAIEFLLRQWFRTQVDAYRIVPEHTLDQMARGGMYDQLGGGFHRYSVDAYWLVPHFEKMLYDNAQLARAYLHAYQASGREDFRRVVEETLDYVVRDMADPSGGFYSTEDADSEGEEGKFYVWRPEEVQALLSADDARLFTAFYDVTEKGNFEHGSSILHRPGSYEEMAGTLEVSEADLRAALERGRAALFAAREQRVRPGRDEKVLAAWNGMMLRAFAEAARVLDRPDYRQVAERNGAFLLEQMRTPDGRLQRTWKSGHGARLNGYLEDYANVADGLVALYEATFEVRWLRAARELADTMLERFVDEQNGGFFDTAADHEALITRPKDLYDNATPSGNAVAADVLLRLALLTANAEYQRQAQTVLDLLHEAFARVPLGFARSLSALDFLLARPKEIALVGAPDDPGTQVLLRTAFGGYLPNRVLAGRSPDEPVPPEIPLLEARDQRDGLPTAYVCEQYVCLEPATDPETLRRQLWPDAA